MKNIKLEKNEEEFILELIKKFQIHSNSIEKIESKLKSIEDEKEKILDELNITRNQEKEFTEELNKKYGKGFFDLKNIGYWIKS